MGRLHMKNVCQKGGRFYFRRKVDGQDHYIRLPSPDDPAFAARYEALQAQEVITEEPIPGTFAALAPLFRKQLTAQSLATTTRANYLRYVDMIVADIGPRPVKTMRPVHIYTLRDRYDERPGLWNNYLTVLRLMFAFAVRRDWRADNPASGIEKLPVGEHLPWPDRVLDAALNAATPMTRLAIITGLCSVQRIGDCVRMRRNWISGGIMQFRQEKRKKEVAIPMHPIWQAEIAKIDAMLEGKPRAMTILQDRGGKPFKEDATLRERINDMMAKPAVQAAIVEAIAAGECPPDAKFTFHGLRKNGACLLKEWGMTDEEIDGIAGMGVDMVRHYTRHVRVLRIAERLAGTVAGGNVLSFKGGRS